MRSNKYAGRCTKCNQWVPAQGGNLVRRQGRWVIYHRHDCQGASAPDPVTEMETSQAPSGGPQGDTYGR